MNIQPIVEGHGEVQAVPVLLRRLRDEARAFELDVNPPIRRNRSELLDEQKLRVAVRLARMQEGCAAILVMFDADRDCPVEKAPGILSWMEAEAGDVPCAVVMPVKEYEAWFLAAIESLRGCRGVRLDAESHPDPEGPRGAKSKLEERLAQGRGNNERADQAALTARLDLAVAHRRCRSFRRMVKAFGAFSAEMGLLRVPWPPADWMP